MPPSPSRSSPSPLPALFLTVFIDLMGFGIVIPLLPSYAERLHATPFAATSLVAVYSLMQLVFAPIWGAVSDRVGRRPVILVSLAGSTVSYLILGAAGSVAMLFVARVLAGIAGANIPVAQAYIADVTTERDRARGMGLIGAAFGLGMVIGPAIGGGLSLLGPRVPEFLAAGLCLANVILAAWRLPEPLQDDATRGIARPFSHPLSPAILREAVVSRRAAVLFALFFLVTFCFAVLEVTFSLAASHLFGYETSQVYACWVYMGVVAVLVQGGLVGRLAHRVAEGRIVLVGCGALVAGLAWVPVAQGVAMLLIALGLVVAGQGLAGPSLSSLISKVTERGHGGVLGLSQSLSSAARVLGPAAGGWVFESLGARTPFFMAAMVGGGAILLSLGLAREAGVPGAEVPREERACSGS